MLPKMRNEKCKKKREWYMKWVLEVSHGRNKERENNTNGEEEHGDHRAWIQ